MPAKKRPDKNSTTAMVKAFANIGDGVAPPDGIDLSNDQERIVWEQFTRARSKDDWREIDLVLVAKAVKIELNIRRYQEQLDQQGAILENARGTQIENPLFRVIDTLQRQQLAIMRSMSINKTGTDPRTVDGKAKTERKARRVADKSDDLLASRSH